MTFAAPRLVEGAPATGEEGTALAEIPVTMIIEGGYFQAVDFFRRLEVRVPRAALLENISIAEGTEQFPSLATTWSGRLFAVVPVATEATDGAEVQVEVDGGGTDASPQETPS